MASGAGWSNNWWNSLRGPDAKALRQIFESLSNFLENPEFPNGVRVGDPEATPTVNPSGVIVQPPTTLLDIDKVVPDDNAAPATPTGLTVTAAFQSILIQWTANTEVDMVGSWGSYRLEVATDSEFATVIREITTGGTIATLTDLDTGTEYWVRIKAIDTHDAESAYSTGVSATTASIGIPDLDTDIYTIPNDDADPATPTGLTVTAGFKALFVKWDTNTESDMERFYGTYQVQLATDTGFTSVVADVTTGASHAAFTDLSTANQYYIRLKAIDAHGNESAWASYASGTPVTVASVDIEPGAVGADEIADFAVAAKKFNTVTHNIY